MTVPAHNSKPWVSLIHRKVAGQTMLASSVQAVVACNATALRVCTLVLFTDLEFPCESVVYFMEQNGKG